MKQSRFILRRFVLSGLLTCSQALSGEPAGELLTRAIDVLSLPPERALSGIAVSIEGVVTAAQPDWGGRFFVQDATAGVFVEHLGERRPLPGDLVRVTGVSHPGGFAPIVTDASWEKLGTAPLPAARPAAIEGLLTGAVDSQRIEVAGTVRRVRVDEYALVCQLMTGDYRLQVVAPPAAVGDADSLVGARVRVRGTAAASFNPQRRQLITMNLMVPRSADFIVEQTETLDPFDTPPIPIDRIAQYRHGQSPGTRAHSKGTVICQRPGEDLFIQDATGGLQVRSDQADVLSPGDVVEVVGFPGFEHFLPVLQDAVFRRTGESHQPVEAVEASLQGLRDGLHHASLVTVEGKILDRMVRPLERVAGGSHREQVIFTVQAENFLFTVEGPSAESNSELAALPLGSTVEVTGVCLMSIAADGTMESLQVLLPQVRNLRVLAKPDWLTPERLLAGLVVLSAVLLVAVSWGFMVARRNAELRTVVREKVRAQQDLQQAHDLLDQRVRERTEQLKFEMTARKEAEVSFRAILTERTRLAQELHDTLEQSLTGIGLQLDTASRLFERRAEGASRHLELAGKLMGQSQLELRRSIWDLRSRELEQFSLPEALRFSARQILADTGVEFELETVGRVRPLSEVVEENLLRIGQEALTNVVKHAGANVVKVRLEFTPGAVMLEVRDDGRGFASGDSPGPREGHFGLLGMEERAKRLDGRLVVVSSPGSGTRIQLEIPVRSPDASPAGRDSRAPEPA